MRNILTLAVVVALTSIASAQSGRHITNPPQRVEAPIETPSSSTTETSRPTERAEMVRVPESILNRKIQGLDKTTFSLADFHDSIVVVNLWASWCGPCRQEVPDYEKVRKEFAGKHVEFIALTTENPKTSSSKVEKFARDYKWGFRLGWAEPDMARTLSNGVNAIPQTFVIATDGRIVSHWRGSGSQSAERLRDAVNLALSGDQSASNLSESDEIESTIKCLIFGPFQL